MGIPIQKKKHLVLKERNPEEEREEKNLEGVKNLEKEKREVYLVEDVADVNA